MARSTNRTNSGGREGPDSGWQENIISSTHCNEDRWLDQQHDGSWKNYGTPPPFKWPPEVKGGGVNICGAPMGTWVQNCDGTNICCPTGWVGDLWRDCQDQAYGCDLSCWCNDGGGYDPWGTGGNDSWGWDLVAEGCNTPKKSTGVQRGGSGRVPKSSCVIGAAKKGGTLWTVKVGDVQYVWIEGYDDPSMDPRNMPGAEILCGNNSTETNFNSNTNKGKIGRSKMRRGGRSTTSRTQDTTSCSSKFPLDISRESLDGGGDFRIIFDFGNQTVSGFDLLQNIFMPGGYYCGEPTTDDSLCFPGGSTSNQASRRVSCDECTCSPDGTECPGHYMAGQVSITDGDNTYDDLQNKTYHSGNINANWEGYPVGHLFNITYAADMDVNVILDFGQWNHNIAAVYHNEWGSDNLWCRGSSLGVAPSPGTIRRKGGKINNGRSKMARGGRTRPVPRGRKMGGSVSGGNQNSPPNSSRRKNMRRGGKPKRTAIPTKGRGRAMARGGRAKPTRGRGKKMAMGGIPTCCGISDQMNCINASGCTWYEVGVGVQLEECCGKFGQSPDQCNCSPGGNCYDTGPSICDSNNSTAGCPPEPYEDMWGQTMTACIDACCSSTATSSRIIKGNNNNNKRNQRRQTRTMAHGGTSHCGHPGQPSCESIGYQKGGRPAPRRQTRTMAHGGSTFPPNQSCKNLISKYDCDSASGCMWDFNDNYCH